MKSKDIFCKEIDALKISVFFEEPGTINGYYNKPLRMKQIHINQDLNDRDTYLLINWK